MWIIFLLAPQQRGKNPVKDFPGYDTKQFDSELLETLWGMRSIPSLSSLLGSLWPRMLARDRALL